MILASPGPWPPPYGMVGLAGDREESETGAWLSGPSWYHHRPYSPFDDGPYPGLVTTLEARKNGRRVRLGVSRGIRGNRWQPDRRREWRSDERAETRPHWEKFEDSRSISTARSGLDRHCFQAPLSWWRIYAGPGWAWCSRPTRQGTARRSWLGG